MCDGCGDDHKTEQCPHRYSVGIGGDEAGAVWPVEFDPMEQPHRSCGRPLKEHDADPLGHLICPAR